MFLEAVMTGWEKMARDEKRPAELERQEREERDLEEVRMQRSEELKQPGWVRRELLIPLRGFVFDETSEAIWMDWRMGRWNIRKSDIVARERWDVATTAGRGIAEIVYIRIDAQIRETDLRPRGPVIIEWA